MVYKFGQTTLTNKDSETLPIKSKLPPIPKLPDNFRTSSLDCLINFKRNLNNNNNENNKFNQKFNINSNATDFLEEAGGYETQTAENEAKRASQNIVFSDESKKTSSKVDKPLIKTYTPPKPEDLLVLELGHRSSMNAQLQTMTLLQNNSNQFCGNTFSKLSSLSQKHFSRGLPELDNLESGFTTRPTKKTPRYVERRRKLVCATVFTLIFIFFNIAIIAISFIYQECFMLRIYVMVGGTLNVSLIMLEWSIVWCCVDSKEHMSPLRRYDRVKLITSLVMVILYAVSISWLCAGSAFIASNNSVVYSKSETSKHSKTSDRNDETLSLCPQNFYYLVILYHVIATIGIIGRLIAFCAGKFCSGMCYKFNMQTRKVGLPLVPIIDSNPIDVLLPPLQNSLHIPPKHENINSKLELKPLDTLGHNSRLWNTLYSHDGCVAKPITSFTSPGLPMPTH